mmetsp:Transcript_5046/g.32099  ORF Transcript_5046/g.32099 Transcript_5046/m.32099 type:complete len:158 (+) Transcript_5046:6625-7098(+)
MHRTLVSYDAQPLPTFDAEGRRVHHVHNPSHRRPALLSLPLDSLSGISRTFTNPGPPTLPVHLAVKQRILSTLPCPLLRKWQTLRSCALEFTVRKSNVALSRQLNVRLRGSECFGTSFGSNAILRMMRSSKSRSKKCPAIAGLLQDVQLKHLSKLHA